MSCRSFQRWPGAARLSLQDHAGDQPLVVRPDVLADLCFTSSHPGAHPDIVDAESRGQQGSEWPPILTSGKRMPEPAPGAEKCVRHLAAELLIVVRSVA